ncbi:MAG: LamG-like jellyroll fold domain-containing protein [Verrucomicrobiota bacterium]|jgi:hypothetical protein
MTINHSNLLRKPAGLGPRGKPAGENRFNHNRHASSQFDRRKFGQFRESAPGLLRHPMVSWLFVILLCLAAQSLHAAPDLIVVGGVNGAGALTVNPNPATAGSNITVGINIENQGTTTAPATTTRLQIKNSSLTVTIADQYYSTPSIAAGQTISQNYPIQIPSDATPGSYGAYVVLDAFNSAGQSDISNDYGSSMPFTVNGPCSYSLSSAGAIFGSSGGNGSVTVTANSADCAWTADTGGASWVTITSGSSGNGNGTVYYTVAANTGTSPRSVNMTIAGQTYSVTQSGVPCSYSLSSAAPVFASSGGNGSVTVSANGADCAWTADTGGASWVTITAGTNGNGNGTVYYTVAANTSASPRAMNMTIAGQYYSVTQAGRPCSYALSSPSASFASSGGNGSVSVTAGPSDCAWTADTGGASWVTITSGSSSNGSGTVCYTVAANAGSSARSVNMTIAGQSYSVTQAGVGCHYSLSSASASFASSGGNGSVTVTANGVGCAWTADTGGASWVTFTSGSSGNGSGTVYYTVAANAGASPRSVNMTIAGQSYSVAQAGQSGSGPTLTGLSLSNCVLSFHLNGPVGSNFLVEASTDLANWTPILTNTIPAGGSVIVTDSGVCTQSKRFYRALTPAAGLVAYYPFDGNAIDASANGFDGTVYGAVPDADRYGRANSSLKFSGTENWVRLDIGPSYFSQDFSLALWIRIDDFEAQCPAIINGDLGYIRLEAAGLLYSEEGNYQKIKFYQLGQSQLWSGNIFQTNRWYHLAIVRSGVDYRMYVDGALSGENAMPAVPLSGNFLQVGDDFSSTCGGAYFHGSLDELRIYSRALSEAEVGWIYRMGGVAARVTNVVADGGGGAGKIWRMTKPGP